MGLKNVLNKLFKSKKNNKIASDDSYCYSKIVWNSEINLIILISFTEDYFEDIIDIQDALNYSQNLNSKIVYSSYDEETDKKDEDGNNIWIIHKKYYMLIGGTPSGWQSLYGCIHNLGNTVLHDITNEITNNCYAGHFNLLIQDDIIKDFKYSKEKPEYDIPKEMGEGSFKYTDPAVVLSRLPNGFTGRDLLKFIMIYKCDNDSFITAYDRICGIEDITNFRDSEYYNLYSALFKNPTAKKLYMCLGPLYKQPDDDAVAGDVDDESLDAIFREYYERFSAIVDDSIHYEDIDEKLSEFEEEV